MLYIHAFEVDTEGLEFSFQMAEDKDIWACSLRDQQMALLGPPVAQVSSWGERRFQLLSEYWKSFIRPISMDYPRQSPSGFPLFFTDYRAYRFIKLWVVASFEPEGVPQKNIPALSLLLPSWQWVVGPETNTLIVVSNSSTRLPTPPSRASSFRGMTPLHSARLEIREGFFEGQADRYDWGCWLRSRVMVRSDFNNHDLVEPKPITLDASLRSGMQAFERTVYGLSKELDKNEKCVYSQKHRFSVHHTLPKFWESVCYEQSSTHRFFIRTAEETLYLGATPESLFDLSETSVRLEALGGSIPVVDGSPLPSFTEKEKREHASIVAHILAGCKRLGLNVRQNHLIENKNLGYLLHLCTYMDAQRTSSLTPFDLMDALYPTPAVNGVPNHSAFDRIQQSESEPRGLYAGLLGCFSLKGVGFTDVLLRCGLYKPGEIELQAGCGILKESDPKQEAKEWLAKFSPLASLCT